MIGRQPVLSVRGLAVAFPGAGGPVPAVRGIDFDVYAGEVLCLVGESGCGKSVAALAISALLPQQAMISGSIKLNGIEVTQADAETLRQMRGRDVGFIFQDPTTTLNPVLPIGRQIAEGQVAHGAIEAAQAPSRAIELLREVEIADPATRVRQCPHHFSGGMRQRAVIAMAMAGRPNLIIADEPTTALDVTVQAQVLAMLARRQAETGAAIILITHDLGVVAEVAHRVLVMYAGRIVEAASVARLFSDPRHPYTAALLRSMPRLDGEDTRLEPIQGQPPTPALLPAGCAFHPRCEIGRDRPDCSATDPELLPVGEQQDAACHCVNKTLWPRAAVRIAVPRKLRGGEKLLAVEKLQVHFALKPGLMRRQIGSVRAVDGVDLVLHEGETLGLVGESGCGKTTTGRAIMGLIRPTGGRVMFQGRDITRLSRRALRPVRRQMQYVFQDPYASLNPMLSVGDIVAEPMRIHGVFEELGGARRVGALLERVGLSAGFMRRTAREFSGGQKQRISIARALALQPKLLILDEPVAALDVSIQAQIVNLLADLQADLGVAYLFIAHDLSVIRHICDRVAVMYLGRIVEESDTATLFRRPLHPYTQSLLSSVPIADPARLRSRILLRGEIPNPARPPSGCAFHPRCFRATGLCATERPVVAPCPDQPTLCACHHAQIFSP